MKKTLVSVMALGIAISPVLAAVPEGVQVEPILSVSADNQAFLKEYGIFQEYTVGGEPISRTDAAKLFVEYLQKAEGETKFNERADHTYNCSFSDYKAGDGTNYIGLACSHGLFKGNGGKFRPNDNITWAETLAVLSRMSDENIQETNPRWNGYYTAALKKDWITAADRSKMDWNITKENFAKLLYAYDTDKVDASKADRAGEQNTNSLENTVWTLELFNGEAVTGTYTLEFKENTLHTSFCNTISGKYTVNGKSLKAELIQTEMACFDGEKMNLEGKFDLTDATFGIASTRMAGDNIQKLAIKTKNGDVFTYNKADGMIGGSKDEHGCLLAAGYARNEAAQECQRPWEHENPLANTERKLTKYNGNDVTGEYTLNFTEDKIHTQFCNLMNGSYSVSGEKITGMLASTRMACIDQEKNTLENNFTIENATFNIASTKMINNNLEILAIKTKDGNTYTWSKIVKKTERTPRDVVDGREYSLRFINGTQVDGEYLINFGDGKLHTKFCNTINGSYTIEDGKMNGTLMSTLMLCPQNEEAMDLENKFTIEGAGVKVEGDAFTLTTKDNDIFARHAIYR